MGEWRGGCPKAPLFAVLAVVACQQQHPFCFVFARRKSLVLLRLPDVVLVVLRGASRGLVALRAPANAQWSGRGHGGEVALRSWQLGQQGHRC